LKAQFDFLTQAVNIPVAWVKHLEEERVFLDLSLTELTNQLDWPGRLVKLLESQTGQKENS
jgi:hypothetical protein